MSRQRRTRAAVAGAPAAAIVCALRASGAQVDAERSLTLRVRRLESIGQIERTQGIFGDYQDRFLFAEAAALFAKTAVVVEEDGRVWSGAWCMPRRRANRAFAVCLRIPTGQTAMERAGGPDPEGPDHESNYACHPWPFAGITPPMHYPHPVTGDFVFKP